MKKALTSLVFAFLVFPSVSLAAALTTDQATSLISVVQSSPGVDANAFVPLITAFSNITVTQAKSLITVVQASPGTAAGAFVSLLTSFTVDPIIPAVATVQAPSGQTWTVNVQPTPVLGSVTPTPIVTQPVVKPNWTINVTTPNGTTVESNKGLVRFEVSVYNKDGQYVKQPVTVTTDDPDLPSSFIINRPGSGEGSAFFFCAGPPPAGTTVLNGCPQEYSVAVGTLTFTFTVENVTVTKQVTVTPPDPATLVCKETKASLIVQIQELKQDCIAQQSNPIPLEIQQGRCDADQDKIYQLSSRVSGLSC